MRAARGGSGSRTCGALRGFATRPAPAPESAFGALSDAVADRPEPRCRRAPTDRYLTQAEASPRRGGFFHWELEFPEVFFDPDGARLPTPASTR
mgnify:CR=1 FL=1